MSLATMVGLAFALMTAPDTDAASKSGKLHMSCAEDSWRCGFYECLEQGKRGSVGTRVRWPGVAVAWPS
jgi:hypothetical protein